MKKVIALLMTVLMAMSLFVGCNQALPKIEINEPKDFDGLKIAVQEATTGDIFSSNGGVFEDEDGNLPDPIFEAKEISRFKKITDAALDLKNGKVDCIVVDEMPAKNIVDANSDLKILDLALTKESYAMAIGKENTELKEKIDAALAELMDNGTYDKLVAKYISNEDVELPEIAEYEATGDLVMGTNAEFAPFEFTTSDGGYDGFDVKLSEYIAAELGLKLVVEDMAFDSLILALTSDKVDFLAAAMTVTAERELEVSFSNDYYEASQVVVVRK